MQIFNTFLKVLAKRKNTAIMYASIFFIIMLLMTFSNPAGSASDFTYTRCGVTLFDRDGSILSEGLCDYLGEQHKIIELKDDSDETVQTNLYYDLTDYVLTIDAGFEESFVEGEYEEFLHYNMLPGNADGYFVTSQITNYLDNVRFYLAAGYEMEEAIAATIENIEALPVTQGINFEADAAESEEIKSARLAFNYFIYLAYVGLMIIVEGLSASLCAMNEKKLDARISVSSIRSTSRSLQIGLAATVVTLTLTALFVVVGFAIFGRDIVFTEAGLFIGINAFAFMFFALSLSLLLSSIFKMNSSSATSSMVSNIVCLSSSFLGGVFVPQWMLSDSVNKVAQFIPTHWYCRLIGSVSGLSGEAFTTEFGIKCIVIQVAFAICFFLVYLVINTNKRRTSLS